MKKLFSFLSIVLLVVVSNCSDIPENNDPILGVWTNSNTLETNSRTASITREEWIFNDVYLGRYQAYSNNELVFYTDFKWSNDNDIYVITYTGTDVEEVAVSLVEEDGTDILSLTNGAVFAIRE
ncbi:MAG: hypothetical protein AAGL34_11900 [Bacteroidota bacterium]